IDRENRIIRAQIQELEKSVIVLNETIIGSARPGSAHSKKAHDKAALSEEKTDSADQTDAAPSAMEASASAAVEGELFLKKEEEPVIVAKKPVVKKLPWTWIALGAGAGLLLLALLALWLRKRKKKAPARSSALASSTAADVAAPADADGADGAEATAAAAPAAKGWAKWWQALKQRWPGKASAGPDDAPARPGLMARMKLALAGVIGKLRKKPTTRPEAEAEPGA
ncbi:MAG: hypothetical protein RL748_3797, partial [Pseudomonadota bacterium]